MLERNRERRASGLKSFYDRAAWRNQTVPFILERDPLCKIAALCQGRAASTEVDHVTRAEVFIAQRDGDPLAFYDADNLQGACRRCHSYKTALENAGAWPPTQGGRS